MTLEKQDFSKIYLLVPMAHVVDPIGAHKTIGNSIAGHPLITAFLPPLCGNFGHSSGSAKIDLDPLVGIVGLDTPCPRIARWWLEV